MAAQNNNSDIQNADKLEEKRAKLIEKVEADAEQMLEEMHKSGMEKDNAHLDIQTEKGTWRLKRNGSKTSVKYLRLTIPREGKKDEKIYVLTQWDPVGIDELVKALKDYQNFVSGFNEWLDAQNDELDEVMELVDDAEVEN